MKTNYAKLLQYLTLFFALLLVSCGGGGGGSQPGTGAVEQPLFSITDGLYDQGQSLSISSPTQSASIRYTTDGSQPSETVGQIYTSPLTLDRTVTVKAVAYRSGWVTSNHVEATFYIKVGSFDVVIRDFTPSHPDFEAGIIGYDLGIVSPTLASDSTPSYLGGAGGTLTTTSPSDFYEWYHDTSGINLTITMPLAFTATPAGTVGFQSVAFFPIDGQGFGNYLVTGHNFHFTMEIHQGLYVENGTAISVTSANDLWVFINGKLAIDLGGVHGASTGTFVFDPHAMEILGVTPGTATRFDIFYAQRHTANSVFDIVSTSPILRL